MSTGKLKMYVFVLARVSSTRQHKRADAIKITAVVTVRSNDALRS